MKTLLLGLVLLSIASTARAADPDVLWKIVNGACVPDQQQHADPKPCAAVSIAGGVEKGWALLKDNAPTKPYHFLLISTAKISGIESPDILFPDVPNYFAAAWSQREQVAKLAGRALPRQDIALAINSPTGRTQNQFHIHVDCVQPGVRDALAKDETITENWRLLPMALSGHHYFARRLKGQTLADNPFVLLADGVSGARPAMGSWTLAVIGAASGFYLLADHATPPLDLGSAEELQDYSCKGN